MSNTAWKKANPKIQAYLPQVLYDRFTEFRNERDMSMSEATLFILAEHFKMEHAVIDVKCTRRKLKT